MTETASIVTLSAAGLIGLAMLIMGSLKGWQGWLDLEHQRLVPGQGTAAPAGARIELADLRERIRKLEAIAAGIDV